MQGTPIHDDGLFVNVGTFAHAGDCVLTHKHYRNGHVLLASGALEVNHRGDVHRYEAPALISIEHSKHYLLTALTDGTVISCIHRLQADETYPPVIEKEA